MGSFTDLINKKKVSTQSGAFSSLINSQSVKVPSVSKPIVKSNLKIAQAPKVGLFEKIVNSVSNFFAGGTKEEKIMNNYTELTNKGFDDATATKLAIELQKSPYIKKEVFSTLSSKQKEALQNVQTKIVQEQSKEIALGTLGESGIGKKVASKVSKLDPLAQEARKYKSAEEFVKALENAEYKSVALDSKYKPYKLSKDEIAIKEAFRFDAKTPEGLKKYDDFQKLYKGKSREEALTDIYNQAVKGGETVIIKDPEVGKLLNDNSDFGKVFKSKYEGFINGMKNGDFSPPISGVNKGKKVVDEPLAKKWALNQTLAMGEETRASMAKRLSNQAVKTAPEIAEIKRVSNNLLKNNPGITQRDAEAMAKDVISNRPFNKTLPDAQKGVSIESKLQDNIKGYQTYGGFNVGKESPNAYLRDVSKQLATPEGQKISKKTLQEAVNKGDIKLNTDGTITLYRVGEVGKANELYSTTYDKAFAEQFAERNGQAIQELKVKPENIKYVIGGVEKEVLLSTTEKVLPQGKQQISALLPQQKVVSSLTNNIPETESAVNRIIRALKEAKPIRGQQEAIYSAKKAQQTAKIVAMGKKVSGEQGYFAQLGQLKGEMPKVQFEAIRKEITQPAIDELFTTIEKNNVLSPFEKINAKTGLSKLLGIEGGTIPTKGELSLLNEVFPPEFVQTILEKRPFIEKVFSAVGNALNIPRAVMATADLSAPLRQGIFLIGKPKQWLPAFKDMFKYAFNEKAYQGLMTQIKARPTYPAMRQSGLSLTEMGTDLLKREEQFMSNLVEKIPVFGKLAKGSNRAYSGFLNKLRADVFDDLLSKATSQGLTKDNSKIVDDIAKFVNSATGRGDLGALNRASVVLNGAFFSPRLMASRINLLNPVYYTKLDPFVRKEALKSLLTFTVTAGSILGLAKIGGAEIGIDPRSADFGKIKVGNTRYDVLGGFQQYIVLASRLLSGQMVSSTTGKEFTLGEGYKPTTRLDIIQRFFESKTSPVASFALGLAKGQTTMGEDFKPGVEIIDRFIPMLAQDMFDLYREKGTQGLFMGLPGAFGVGSQTYSDLMPLESKTATGKPTVQFRQQPSLGETILNKITGKKIEPIPVKAVYDEVQILKNNGKISEAKKIVDDLSENDYALYKKLKAKDDRIKSDETISRITPVYKNVRKLVSEGKTMEAQKIIDGLTDEEYKAYKSIKALDYKNIK